MKKMTKKQNDTENAILIGLCFDLRFLKDFFFEPIDKAFGWGKTRAAFYFDI